MFPSFPPLFRRGGPVSCGKSSIQESPALSRGLGLEGSVRSEGVGGDLGSSAPRTQRSNVWAGLLGEEEGFDLALRCPHSLWQLASVSGEKQI